MNVGWKLGLVACGCFLGSAAWALSLEEALLRAGEAPDTRALAAEAEASGARLVAAGRLPDPRLVLGVEDFMLEGDARYRVRDSSRMISVMQEIPSSSRRAAQRQQARAALEETRRAHALSRLAARREASLAWIRLYFLEQKQQLLAAQQQEIRLRQEVAKAALAGGAKPEAALETLLEAQDLAEAADLLARDIRLARVGLARWIGPLPDSEGATGELPPWLFADAPQGSTGKDAEDTEHVTELRASAARIGMAEAEVALARAGKDANWNVEFGLGQDAMGKNMLMAKVGFSLPLFAATRQDPGIAAAWAALRRSEAEHAARRAEFERQRMERQAEAQTLALQLARLETETLPLLERGIALAEATFSSGTGTAAALIRAREKHLAARMRRVELESEHALVRARLYFLQEREERADVDAINTFR
ncbi:MAG: TolC family protein [Zoogloeaceae bacterium]|nr:TolC family protein [Zoogloeaceae bacterium]